MNKVILRHKTFKKILNVANKIKNNVNIVTIIAAD